MKVAAFAVVAETAAVAQAQSAVVPPSQLRAVVPGAPADTTGVPPTAGAPSWTLEIMLTVAGYRGCSKLYPCIEEGSNWRVAEIAP